MKFAVALILALASSASAFSFGKGRGGIRRSIRKNPFKGGNGFKGGNMGGNGQPPSDNGGLNADAAGDVSAIGWGGSERWTELKEATMDDHLKARACLCQVKLNSEFGVTADSCSRAAVLSVPSLPSLTSLQFSP